MTIGLALVTVINCLGYLEYSWSDLPSQTDPDKHRHNDTLTAKFHKPTYKQWLIQHQYPQQQSQSLIMSTALFYVLVDHKINKLKPHKKYMISLRWMRR